MAVEFVAMRSVCLHCQDMLMQDMLVICELQQSFTFFLNKLRSSLSRCCKKNEVSIFMHCMHAGHTSEVVDFLHACKFAS